MKIEGDEKILSFAGDISAGSSAERALAMLPGRAAVVSSLRAEILLSNGINRYPLV